MVLGDGTLQLARIFNNRVLWCPLLSRPYPSLATTLFFVGQKANPDIHSSYVESVRRSTNLDAGVVCYYILHFSCPFYKFEAASSISLGHRMETYLQVREIAGERMPEAVTTALQPQQCSPLKLPVPWSMLPAGLQICTHKEFLRKGWHIHHLQYSVLTAEGFERPSAQSTWSSGPCTRASRGTVIQRARWFLQVWSEQEHLYPSLA